MSKQDIITAIFGKTESGEPYTLKQGLVFVWFAFSLSALCLLAEGWKTQARMTPAARLI
jgi:hypothetical protein